MPPLIIDITSPTEAMSAAAYIALGLHVILSPDEKPAPEPAAPFHRALYRLGILVAHAYQNRPASMRTKPRRKPKPKVREAAPPVRRTVAPVVSIGSIADQLTRTLLRPDEDPANSA